MDLYSMKRWILERHEAVIRTAEVRSRVGVVDAPPSRLSVWLAGNLRHLADRLDSQLASQLDGPSDTQTHLEGAAQ
jgi:hypothetical protein